MSHVKHLRVETEAELVALDQALEDLARRRDQPRSAEAATGLLERLRATPAARHGGIVHVEDANYLPTPASDQRATPAHERG